MPTDKVSFVKGRLWAKAIELGVAALVAAAALADTPSKAKVHGLSVTGTVVSADTAARKMTIRAAGKSVPLVWTAATKTVGGTVKTGAKVTVRYLEKDGKNIATSISIEDGTPAAAAAAATAPAAPTPTATAAAAPKSR